MTSPIDHGTTAQCVGAACHGCLPISETSCEMCNLFLDRNLPFRPIGVLLKLSQLNDRYVSRELFLKFKLVLYRGNASLGACLVLVTAWRARDANGAKERASGLNHDSASKRRHTWQAR
jgi:hypothetical protein